MGEAAKKIDLFGGKNPQEALEEKIQQDLSTVSDALVPVKPYDDEGKGKLKQAVAMSKDMIKKIKDHHKPIIDSIRHSLDVARDKQKEALAPVEEVQQKAQELLNQVVNEEYRIAEKKKEEQQRVAREEAAKRREAAKANVEEIMARAKDTDGKLNEIEAALEHEDTSEEEAALLRHYHHALSAQMEGEEGELSAAAAEVGAPVELPATESVPQPKTDGVSVREKVTVEVDDMKLLCAAIGRGDVPVAAVKAMQGKLNSYARDGIKLPGCSIRRAKQAVVNGK